MLNQTGLDIDAATHERLEKYIEAPVKWIDEPEVHNVLGVPKNRVRRINAVMLRLENKWKGEEDT